MKSVFQKIKQYGSNLFIVLGSILAVMATSSNHMLIIGAESENAILNFMSKFSASFSTFNFADLLSFVGMFFLLKYVSKNTSKFDIIGAILSFFLTFLYIWSFCYKNTNDSSMLFANTYQTFFTITIFIGYFILFYSIFEFICILLETISTQNSETNNSKIIFIMSLCIILICWIPWIIMNYPGSIAGDTIAQLDQYFSGKWNAHHPPFSTLLIGSTVHLGELLIDKNFGVFLYLFIQAILGSVIFSYSIVKMHVLGVRKKYCALAIVFFACTPIFGLYAQWLQKDMLYSLFALLYTILMIDILRKEIFTIKDIIIFFLVGMLVSLLRNNGIYIVIPTGIILVIYLKKKLRIQMAVVSLSSIILYFLISSVLYPSLGIKDGSVREALSIPMQQSARYIRDYGNELTEPERTALLRFCASYETLPELYDPTCADPVKDVVNVELSDPVEYFSTWFTMGLKHPDTYVDAFLNMNYGYLAPNEQNVEPDLSAAYHEQLINMGFSRQQGDIPIQIFSNIVFINVVFPFLRYLTMPGLYTWIIIISIFLLIKFKKKHSIILLVPAIMTILVCLASPLCNGMRYELPVLFSTPLIISWTWSEIKGYSFLKKPNS